MSKITNNGYSIILATFLRPEKLEKCLHSISNLHIKPEKVVVGDNGKPTKRKDKIYSKYKKCINLEVVNLEFDAGLSKARNEAFKKTNTDYVLLIDDDHYLPTNIYEIREVLDENHLIGGVSPFWEENGEIRCGAADLQIGDVIIKGVFQKKKLNRTSSGIGFYNYDMIPNTTMFKKSCLSDYLWDEFFIIGGEHADFYITHKKMRKWKFAVTPDYIIIHDKNMNNVEYVENRTNVNKIKRSMSYLKKKHNIKDFIQMDVHMKKKIPLKRKILRIFPYRIRIRALKFYKNLT